LTDLAGIKEEIAFQYINTKPSSYDHSKFPSKKPSFLEMAKVTIKLIPIIWALRKDRKSWINDNSQGLNNNYDEFREHARRALRVFIELGPSYVKMGQWLSTRADMLPAPYLEELARLQDDVPPADFSKVKPIIESEIGKIEEVFDSFIIEPISGASLGQVYLARYKGREVIVKVSRPNIEEQVGKDIYILRKILPVAARFVDHNLRFSVEGMLSQFIETIHEEMDYLIEAGNLKAIKENLEKNPNNLGKIKIPDVFEGITTKHVLTMEYIPGVKVTEVATIDAMGINRKELLVYIYRLFFGMLLHDNIFHADPHPGNISIAENGQVILYDFGMVGRYGENTRLKLVRLYLALADKDARRTANILKELDALESNYNPLFVEKMIDLSIQSLYGKQTDEMEVKALIELANRAMTRFPFRLPKSLALYMRMVSLLDGIYHQHKMKFQIMDVLTQLIQEEGLVAQAYIEEGKVAIKRLLRGIESAANIAVTFEESLSEKEYHRTNIHNSSLTDSSHNNNSGAIFIGGSVLATGLFIGSSIIMPYSVIAACGGYAASIASIVLAVLLRNRL
jgi:predicted unusual protein kinase regulating ubiquinone biosynthesis (AarF/ABC1/UbiB family)